MVSPNSRSYAGLLTLRIGDRIKTFPFWSCPAAGPPALREITFGTERSIREFKLLELFSAAMPNGQDLQDHLLVSLAESFRPAVISLILSTVGNIIEIFSLVWTPDERLHAGFSAAQSNLNKGQRMYTRTTRENLPDVYFPRGLRYSIRIGVYYA